MKKITLALLLCLFALAKGHSQVLVGEGTNTEQVLPINAYYGYTYSQSIYLASEINASGAITTLQWYYSGAGDLTNSQSLVIYFGQTDKIAFDSSSDFIPISSLTQVYAGGIVTNSLPGWKTITLTTPYVYSATSNLVIAVDENMPDYDGFDDDFYNTSVTGQRSIYAFSDTINFDPADPNNDQGGDFPARATVAFVPNIILGGIEQACPNPSGILVSNVGITNATATWVAAVGQTNWEVLIQETDLGVPPSTQNGIAVTGLPTYTASNLTANINYTVYVRAICSDVLKSGWVASQSFNTLCLFSGDFVQDFDTTTIGSVPACWSFLNLSTNQYAYINTVDYNSASEPNCIEFYNSDDASAPLYLITPGLTSIGANTHRIKFKAKSPGNYSLTMGTMSDPTNDASFTALQTYALNSEYTDYSYTFNNSTADSFIAFKHGGGSTYTYVFIDDVVWEPLPTQVPGCLSIINVTTNEGCGNFPTVFEWGAVPGADGYYVSVGTAPNGGDLVINNANVYSALTYSFSGNPSTTYYYTVTPYNALGSALSCFEDSFTTYSDGCYCVSAPDGFDGSGITMVKINDSEFINQPVSYTDFSESGAVDIAQGVLTTLNISFATFGGYNANVWIDYNDNFTFEPSELVYTGVSANTATSLLSGSFLPSLTANLGLHRMRIGATATYILSPPNPCFNNYGGITLDFMVNVLPAPACFPPSSTTVTNVLANTAQINWVSNATSYSIEYGYAPLIQGSGTVVSGITTNFTTLANLEGQVDYNYYLRSDCGVDGVSPWIGPFVFKTACDAFVDFTENFETEETITAPECWYTLINSTSDFASIQDFPFNGNIEMYNSDDANAAMYLITPNLVALPLASHRTKFKARSFGQGAQLVIGTMTDPNLESTFTAVETILLTDTDVDYAVSFNTITTATHVAFKFVASDSYQSAIIDNFVWQPIPTAVPPCAVDVTVETSTDCGNFPSLLTWSEVPSADFYTLSIGTTTAEGTTLNLGNVTSYAFEGNFDATYYYTLIPTNAFGPAAGCIQGSFTTYDEGCYCDSVSESSLIDGDGVTNLIVGNTSFPIPVLSYIDLTDQDTVELEQGITANVAITFETGYTYNANIWIDWNDNYVFESSELMFSGESTNAVPSVLDASFMVPATAALGEHRMRIGTADSGQEIPNPCFTGFYAISMDLNIELLDPLGSAEFDKASLVLYPIPVKDVLHVRSTQNITSVSVYNMLGQEVVLQKVQAELGQVDMSALSSGTYLVKVTSEAGIQTMKVVKQ